MIGDNIKRYRKEKGMSQEEMAVRLHVVRQTVSKWEKNKSVPDAETLTKMAELLEVSVNDMLGLETGHEDARDMMKELVRLNSEITDKIRKEQAAERVNEKRNLILFLTFASIIAAFTVKNQIISLFLSGGCILIAVIVLYRNLTLLTSESTADMRIGILRITTAANGIVFFAVIMAAVLTALDVISFSEHGEKMFAALLVTAIIIFGGIISPKLPFTRHTGLRLPWTIRDEETWQLAHRIIGIISLPLALLYVACVLTTEYMEQVTLITMLLWIGIPGGISYVYYYRKMWGKTNRNKQF